MSDNNNDSFSIEEEERTRGLRMSCSYLFLYFLGNLTPTKSKVGNRTFLSLIICAIVVVSTISLIIPDHKAMAQTTETNMTTNSTTSNAALLDYTNSTAGIKIQYPSNWQPQRPDNPFDTLRFISPIGGILGIQVSDIPLHVSLGQEATSGVNMLSKSFDNFSLLSSTPTTIAGGNPAQRIEYTAKQGQLDLRFIQVVTIKDGREYILTFGAPKDQFPSDLPAVQQIVDSFQIISNRSLPVGTLSLLPSSPSSSNSSTTSNATDLNTAREQYLSAWKSSGFHSQFDSFVNSTEGYGIYQEHNSNIFKPGEDIILYVEPVGFSHVPVSINNTRLYLINLTASIILSDTQGNILFGRENVPIFYTVSHTQNTEMFARLRVGQSSPFPPGGYVITYILTDVPSGKSFKIVKNITISGVNGGVSRTVNETSSLSTSPPPPASSAVSNNTSASQSISPPTITTSPPGWHSYTNSTYGISLLYPPDWMQSPVAQSDGINNTAYYIMDFVPPISQDPTADTILGIGIDNTTRQSIPSLNQYAYDTINSYRSAANVTDFKVIKAGTNITMGGHPGYILYYTKKVQSNPAPRTYLEAGTIANNTIYYIQVGSAMSEKQFTDIMLPQVMQIIKSFRILHPISLQSEQQQQTETSQQEVQQQQIPGITP